MLLPKSTHLLFARNVLSSHTQSFRVICNNFSNANFSKSCNFYPQHIYASDDHFQIFENRLKFLFPITYNTDNILCVQCSVSKTNF